MAQLPADLTPVVRHLDEWQPPHTERHLVKANGLVTSMDLAFQLPHDLNSFTFSKYAAGHIRDHNFGTAKGALRMPILSKQTARDNAESTDISRVIIQYLFDPQLTPDRRAVLANYVVQKGINNDAIRDEIYLQLCSQSMGIVTRSPGQPAELVWSLITACLSCFPPSATLAKYLLKFVSDNGLFGYDSICQHKLLHCLQQQNLRTSGQNRVLRMSRTYPPCLLEWKAAASKGSMALNAVFPDGEKLVGHVESWTTAEQFAANLLSLRHIVDGASGWSVTLHDEVDWYECPGHDFVLDLVSEMEVPPSFPCGTAYFLPFTDTVRANATFNNRQKWPNQPHIADRLRLMPLEVDELPDHHGFHSLSPPTPAISASPIPVSASPPPPVEKSIPAEDLYAARDELMSKNSALNKRHEPAAGDQLSKTSALNSRYVSAATPSEPVAAHPRPSSIAAPQLSTTSKLNQRYVADSNPTSVDRRASRARPDPPQRTTPVRTHENHDEMIDNWFVGIADHEDTATLENPRALQGQIRGGGDNNPAMAMPQYSLGAGLAFQSPPLMSPYGHPVMSSVPSSGIMSPSFVSPLQPLAPIVTDPTMMYQQQLYQQQLLQQQNHQQQLIQQQNQQQMLQQQQLQQQQHQQQQQQQLIKHKQQQTAELQVALEAQKMQNEVLQTSVQNELLKQQLVELQRRNTVAAATPYSPPVVLPPPAGFGRPVSDPSHPTAPVVTIGAPRKYPPPVKQKTVGGLRSTSEDQQPQQQQQPGTAVVNGQASKPAGSRFGAGAAAAAAAVHNGPAAAAVSPPSASAAAPPPPPPPPPVVPLVNGDSTDNNANSAAAAPAAAAAGMIVTSAAARRVVDASAADKGSIRRPPKKIGQIRWPPAQEEDAKAKNPPFEIGRIKIDEAKEETDLVSPRQPPEEIQRRINDMIQAARAADAAGEIPKKRPIPPVRPNRPQSDIGLSSINMKQRQEQLEQQLMTVRRKKMNGDGPEAAAPVAAAAVVVAALSAPSRIPIPPPPPPVMASSPPLSVVSSPREPIADQIHTAFDIRSLDNKRTVLHAQSTDPYFLYDRVPWTLELRKEVFSPAEKLENQTLVNMVFMQIIADVYNEDCIRIGKEDRAKLTVLLDQSGVSYRNARAGHSAQVKRTIINAAREMPFYFSRLFAVNGGRLNQRVQMVAVGHSGVRLLNRFKDNYSDVINILTTIRYEEISEVSVPRPSTVLLRTTSQQHVVYTPRAAQLCNMVEAYRVENSKLGGARAAGRGARESLSLNLAGINDNLDEGTIYDDTRLRLAD